MIVKSEDWDSFLEAVSSNRVDLNYIETTLLPLINHTGFVTHIDNLGECALFYAITYQNKLLLNHLLERTSYDLLEKKLKKKLRLSIFRGIKQISYNSKTYASFLYDVIQSISNSPCQNILKEFVQEGLFEHLFESVFQKEKKSFDLINSIIIVLKEQLLLTEDDTKFKNLQTIQQGLSNSCLWSHFAVRNFIKNPSFPLSYLEYEFFHHVAEKGLYNQMEAFNLTKSSEFLLKKNSSGENVFLILFKKAPFEFLNKHLTDFAEALNTIENPLILTNNRKQNFLHLFILNKKASLQEKMSLLYKINELCNLEEFYKMTDHNKMTPVVLFIQRFSNEIRENLSSMINLIQQLMPKLQENELEHLSELKKSQSFIFSKYLTPRLSSIDIEGANYIYNQKLLKICLDLKLDSLLIALLEKNDYLNIDSFYMETLALARHLLCVAAENNCQDLLKWIVENRINSMCRIQSLTEDFLSLGKINLDYLNHLKQNPNYSIFDLMLDFINAPSFDLIETQTQNIIFDILEDLWGKNTEQDSVQALLNISFTGQTENEIYPCYFVIKAIKASKHQRMFNLFRNDILKLRDHVNKNYKKGILIDMLRSDVSAFFKHPEFNFLVTDARALNENELSYLCRSLVEHPQFIQQIAGVCPQLKIHLVESYFYTLFGKPQFGLQKMKTAAKGLSKLIADSFLVGPPELTLNIISFQTKTHNQINRILFVEIIRYLIQEKKAAEFIKRLDQADLNYKCSDCLNTFCYEYVKGSINDQDFEEQLITLYSQKECNFTTTFYKLETLEQLEKIGRMKLKGWRFNFVNVDSFIKQMKTAQTTQTPLGILYLRLFTTQDKSWINSCAIEICKESEQSLNTMRSIYSFLYQNNYPELELLNHAILSSDPQGVEAIVDNHIYSEHQSLQARSPFYTILELLHPFKISDNSQSLNQIIHKFFTTLSKDIITTWLLPIVPDIGVPNIKRLCFLREAQLHRFLTEENFTLIPFKSILTEAAQFLSIRGEYYSSVSFCVQAIYERKAETIQTFLPLFLQIQPEEHLWYLKEKMDFELLHFSYLLLNPEKFQVVLELLRAFKSHKNISSQIKSSFKFCLQSKDKAHLQALVKLCVSEKVEFRDNHILKELQKCDQLSYHLLRLSNACIAQNNVTDFTIILNDFIQMSFEDFKKLFDAFSQTARFEDLKYLFLTRDIAEALAVNGLHKKLQFLINLVQKLVQDNHCTQQDFIEWIQRGLESSCQINIFINADKATEKTKGSQFNYFDLGTQLMIKTNKLEAPSRFLPNFSKFVRIESGLSEHSHESPPRQIKRPILSEQNPNQKKPSKTSVLHNKKPQSSGIYGKRVVSSKLQKPQRLQEDQPQKPNLHFVKTVQPLFQSYPTDWTLKNQTEESSLEKTILLLLETLMNLYNFEKLTDEITPIIQNNLILATQSKISLVQNILEKYLDKIQTQDFESYAQFYLQILLTFFQTATCFKLNQTDVKDFSQDLDTIKFLFNRLTSIQKISEITKPLLENLVCQIYQYRDIELGQLFCEKISKGENLIPREIVNGIFLHLSIQQENLSCFASLLKLNPSIESVCQIVDQGSVASAEPFAEKHAIQKKTILSILFSKNLFKFIDAYDQLHNLSLLQPITHTVFKSKKSIILKTIPNPTWIHLALLKGSLSIFENYSSKTEFAETEVECAFYSQNFDLVKAVLQKAFISDPQRILEFLTSKRILLRLLQGSPENFILQVLGACVFESSLNSIQVKLIFNISHLKETDEHGWTAFHYIAFRKLSHVFYSLLSFIKTTLCDNDPNIFIQTMTNLLTFATSYSFFALDSPDHQDDRFAPLDLCPIQVSIASRFYELLCFVAEFNISVRKSISQLPKVQSEFKFAHFDKSLPHNEFSGLFVELTKTLTRIMQLLQTLGSSQVRKLPSNWILLVEEMLFALPLKCSNPEFVTQDISQQLQTLKETSIDTILIKLDLSLANLSNSELSPLAFIYLLDKTSQAIGLQKTNYSKHMYQHYLQEMQNETYQESKEEKLFAKLWLDTELNHSIDKVIRILNLTSREQAIIQNPELLGLTEDVILKTAAIYNSKSYKIALKTLILAFPPLFIQIPEALDREEEAEKPNSFNFWKHFINYPNYMCTIISSINDDEFNSLISTQFETLLSFYEEAHTNSYSQHEIQSWATCILYILFSLRGETTSPLLAQTSFPSLFKRVLTPLIKIDEKHRHGHGQTKMFYLFFKNFYNFAIAHQLTFRKTNVSDKNILKEIGSDIIHSFLPFVLPAKKNDVQTVTIQDQDFDTYVDFAASILLEKSQNEQNPLTFYPNFICMATQIFDLIQEVIDYADKFKIAINLSINPSPSSQNIQIKKMAPNKLQMDVGYFINQSSIDKSFFLEWDTRQSLDIEHSIENLFIIDHIQKNLEANLTTILKEDSRSPAIDIDYNSLEEAPFEEKYNLLNNQLYLDFSHKTYFGILPYLEKVKEWIVSEDKSNLPIINEIELSQAPLKIKDSLIAYEFYQLFYPTIAHIKISYLGINAFKEFNKDACSFARLFRSLSLYEQTVTKLSKATGEEIKDFTIDNVDWFIGGEPLSFAFNIFYHDVYQVKQIMNQFSHEIQEFGGFNLLPSSWKVNTKSLLTAASTLTEAIRNAVSSSISSKEVAENSDRKKIIETYLNRRDDALKTTENYLRSSILNKIIYTILENLSTEKLPISKSYNAIYITLEDVPEPKDSDKIADWKNFHLFDQIIRFSGVLLQPADKVLLVKINYFVHRVSFQDLEENSLSSTSSFSQSQKNQDYIHHLFSKFEIYRQIMTPNQFVDHIIDKKLIDDSLISMSSSISAKISKRINFSFDFKKLYELCTSLINKATSSTTPKLDSNQIFANLEEKIFRIKDYISKKMASIVEESILSDEYMDELTVKVQIQNMLFASKKSYSQYLEEERLVFNIYPPKNPNKVLLCDIPWHITQTKFAFLIQTNKELTVPNALIGQQYLIVTPSRIWHHKVSANSPLPYEGDAHYLLISASWPDLDFCSNKFTRVLVLDGRNRILDIFNSNIKELVEDLKNEDIHKRPYLLNKNWNLDSDITVHNLFSVYPSLFVFQIASLDPESTDLRHSQLPSLRQGTSSQLFDEQKTVKMSFLNHQKLQISSLLLDNVKFSEKLNTSSVFQTAIYDFQTEFNQMLDRLDIKELLRDNQKVPKIAIRFEDDFRYSSSIQEFCQYFKLLITEVKEALFKLLHPVIPKLDEIQETACLLYDQIYLENNIISYRILSSLCGLVQNFELIFKNSPVSSPIAFNSTTQTLQIFIHCLDPEGDEDPSHSSNFHFNYPVFTSILSFILDLLIRQESKLAQNIIAENKQQIAEFEVMMSKINFNVALDVNPDHAQDQGIQQDTLITLLFLDLILWNTATALNLLQISASTDEKFTLKITNTTEVVEKNTLTLKIASNFTSLVPTYQEIYQKLNHHLTDSFFHLKVKPLRNLTFVRNETAELSFAFDLKDLTQQDLDKIHIGANLLGIQSLGFYSLQSFEISKTAENLVVRFILPSDLPSQNYFIYLSLNNRLIFKPFLINVFKPPHSSSITDALHFYIENVMNQKQTIQALIKSPFYLLAESKHSLSEDKHINSLIQYLLIHNQDPSKSFSKFDTNLIKINSKVFDESNIFYRVILNESLKLKFSLSSNFYTFSGRQESSIQTSFWTESQVSLQNTQVKASTGHVYTSSHNKEKTKEFEGTYGEDFKQIYKNLDSIAIPLNYDGFGDFNNFITEIDLEKPQVKKFMDANFIQNLGKQDYHSKTGEERKESLQFRDKSGQEVLLHYEEVLTYSAVFVHNRNHDIIFEGKISHQEQNFFVTWTPLIKGSYSLILNGKFVMNANNLLVIASESSTTKSTFRWPRMEFYALYDTFSFEAELRDRFGNRLNQIEVDKYYQGNKTVQLQVSQQATKPKVTYEKINNSGVQTNSVIISPNSLEDVFTDAEITLTFLLNETPVHSILLKVLGVGFRKRLELFYNDVQEFRSDYNYTSLTVSRLAFLKSLSDLKLEKFKSVNHITFVNEPGADAGGLRREFWELVGKEMKNSTYKIFAGSNDKYFLSYDYTLNEKTQNTLKLYGALIASSILHRQLIGVNFSSAFSKALFDGNFDLEDLKEVFGEQVYNNYKMLNNMSDQDLDSLEQHFTVNIKDKQYQLLPDGDSIKVTKENLKLFLERLVQFYFLEYHQKAIDLIKEGFKAILPLQRLTKWFVSSDLSLLTYGTLNVTGTNILKFTKFGGHESSTLQQFFTQFLLESDHELLRNFLKFVTGSSALPYDDPFYSLLVTFENQGASKLPISHTCSKHIEVPRYRNYEQMKKMLTIAFIHASEGFGFA